MTQAVHNKGQPDKFLTQNRFATHNLAQINGVYFVFYSKIRVKGFDLDACDWGHMFHVICQVIFILFVQFVCDKPLVSMNSNRLFYMGWPRPIWKVT